MIDREHGTGPMTAVACATHGLQRRHGMDWVAHVRKQEGRVPAAVRRVNIFELEGNQVRGRGRIHTELVRDADGVDA